MRDECIFCLTENRSWGRDKPVQPFAGLLHTENTFNCNIFPGHANYAQAQICADGCEGYRHP